MTDSTPRPSGSSFVNVGERTNVTGSAKFRKLIEAGDYPAALDVARVHVLQRALEHRVAAQQAVEAPQRAGVEAARLRLRLRARAESGQRRRRRRGAQRLELLE